MATTVVPCPKCRLPVRLREGEASVQCASCGTTTYRVPPASTTSREARPVGAGPTQAILVASLLALGAGLAALGVARRHPSGPPTASTSSTSSDLAPPLPPPPPPVAVPTPAGEIAWNAGARAPVVTAVNSDAVEDVFGFFRVWDGRSAWIAHAGAFDGQTMKELWETDPIDPQLINQPGVVPLATVAGPHVVVADASPTLRVFKLATGEKEATLRLAGPVMEVCASPDQANAVWVKVVGGPDTTVDLAANKSTAAPRPKWCLERDYQNPSLPVLSRHPSPAEVAELASKKLELAACSAAFENRVLAKAKCRAPAAPHGAEGFAAVYELESPPVSVAFGTRAGRGYAQATGKASWGHAFAAEDANGKPEAPVVSDIAFGRVYVVYERVYFDARLAALDAATGAVLWEAPLVGSVPTNDGDGRGTARALVATAARVYVVRSGGGLDVFEASSGKPVGTIGKQ